MELIVNCKNFNVQNTDSALIPEYLSTYLEVVGTGSSFLSEINSLLIISAEKFVSSPIGALNINPFFESDFENNINIF